MQTFLWLTLSCVVVGQAAIIARLEKHIGRCHKAIRKHGATVEWP